MAAWKEKIWLRTAHENITVFVKECRPRENDFFFKLLFQQIAFWFMDVFVWKYFYWRIIKSRVLISYEVAYVNWWLLCLN